MKTRCMSRPAVSSRVEAPGSPGKPGGLRVEERCVASGGEEAPKRDSIVSFDQSPSCTLFATQQPFNCCSEWNLQCSVKFPIATISRLASNLVPTSLGAGEGEPASVDLLRECGRHSRRVRRHATGMCRNHYRPICANRGGARRPHAAFRSITSPIVERRHGLDKCRESDGRIARRGVVALS